MNALVVRQPHAALIVAGIKTIETRPSPPNGPMRPADVRGLPGLPIEPGERIAVVAGRAWAPRWNVPYATETDADADLVNLLDGVGARFTEPDDDGYSALVLSSLPLGAVVGTVEVTRALQVQDCSMVMGHLCRPGGGGLLAHSPISAPWPDGKTEHVVDDELPLGDFTLGRWGWMLAAPQRCEPVPVIGRQGVFRLPDDVAAAAEADR